MRYTENFHLRKPEGSDHVLVEDFNVNADQQDTIMKQTSDTAQSASDQAGIADGKADQAVSDIAALELRVQALEQASKVASFNGRTGVVAPATGDYSTGMITGFASDVNDLIDASIGAALSAGY